MLYATPDTCPQTPCHGSKAQNSIDLHVGSRARMRRVMLYMSQEKLAVRHQVKVRAAGRAFWLQVVAQNVDTRRVSAGPRREAAMQREGAVASGRRPRFKQLPAFLVRPPPVLPSRRPSSKRFSDCWPPARTA